MTTATVVQTRNNPHVAPLTPAQIKAQRRSQTLTPAELTMTAHGWKPVKEVEKFVRNEAARLRTQEPLEVEFV